VLVARHACREHRAVVAGCRIAKCKHISGSVIVGISRQQRVSSAVRISRQQCVG
jgi:hypothetical protein